VHDWTFDERTQQGATVIVDATDGRVLQVVTFIV